MSNPPFRNTQPSDAGGGEPELAARRQAGALLRAAREAAGRSLNELATQLKVSPDKISALETGEWERLHDAAHARGLLRAAAKAVRADADEVLRPLPPVFVRGTPILPAAGVTMGPARPAEPVGTHGSGRRLVWLGLLVVVVALGLMVLPRAERLGYVAQQLRALLTHRAAGPGPGVTIVPGSPPAGPASAAASAPDLAPPASPAGSSAVSSVLPSASSAVALAPAAAAESGRAEGAPGAVPGARPPGGGASAASARTPAASAPAPAGGASASAAAAGPPGPLLNLGASAQSWVRVRSQSGRVLYTGLLAPGASQDVATRQGDFPLHLTVGNAAQTRVSLGGKPVAMQAGGGNVARLVLQGTTP
ncbi:RodZ domain-containing protein [Thiomonas sp. FB-6]|uniref:RodZ domain-containing protein n=1 Tax=Thiomonas sp. FB-6 TaxID=1158291 RepID=UPI000373C85A|nr:RodZ domain-containing protein [Thiomonas sp. FB-6]